MEVALALLAPDHIAPYPPRIIERDGFLVGVYNPADSMRVHDHAVCLGVLLERGEDWSRVGSPAPDGSYALFRDDGVTVEVLTDIVGTRSVWYAQTPEWFIASTSQRAIVIFLQDYQPNPAAYPWMLSSGTLGPGWSWDRRILCLSGDSRLRLDRIAWTVNIERQAVRYKPLELPAAEHTRRLQQALAETFARLDVDYGKWILPLSGGVDSRAILMLLKDRPGLRTLTWGMNAALSDRKSDAQVAKALAAHLGVEHQYYPLDAQSEPIEDVFKRFLFAGEGRVDHIPGYFDGCGIWKYLHDSGCQGVIRGDEAFGCLAAQSPWEVYRNMGLVTMEDYRDIDPAKKFARLLGQHRPKELEQRAGESLEAWRDRLNAEFEAPAVFAALNDLKVAYIEIISPLLSRRIVKVVRQFPDAMRTNKFLFRRLVIDMAPHIPFAKTPAIARREDILKNPSAIEILADQLGTSYATTLFPKELRDDILVSLRTSKGPNLVSTTVRRVGRKLVRVFGMRSSILTLDYHVLAFRAYIIAQMHDILTQDATALKRMASASRVVESIS